MITNKIAISPVTFFRGVATKAEARWVTSQLGAVGGASVDLHLWTDEDVEVDSKVVAVSQEVYDNWSDDAEFLAEVVRAAGLTPVEPVAWIEVADPFQHPVEEEQPAE